MNQETDLTDKLDLYYTSRTEDSGSDRSSTFREEMDNNIICLVSGKYEADPFYPFS